MKANPEKFKLAVIDKHNFHTSEPVVVNYTTITHQPNVKRLGIHTDSNFNI